MILSHSYAARKNTDLAKTRSRIGLSLAKALLAGVLKASEGTLLSPWTYPHTPSLASPVGGQEQRTLPGIQHVKVVSLQWAILAFCNQAALRCAPRFCDARGFSTGRVRLQNPQDRPLWRPLEFLPAALSPGLRDLSRDDY